MIFGNIFPNAKYYRYPLMSHRRL